MAAEPDDARHGDELPVIEPPATRSSGTKFPGTESRVTRPAGARLPATRPADVEPPVPGPSVAELLALLEADGELTAEQAAALARLADGPRPRPTTIRGMPATSCGMVIPRPGRRRRPRARRRPRYLRPGSRIVRAGTAAASPRAGRWISWSRAA